MTFSSDQEFDDKIASIDTQTNVMDYNASNDIIDSQLNSKDNDDSSISHWNSRFR